jgi:1-acyl-sn-glycerol-3-phosphate acyltransferase
MLYRILRAFLSFCLHVMYRRIEAPGSERFPREGGVLLVANHGNALVDPLLLLILVPRPITFLAKHTLFRVPVLGFFLRRIGGLPVYRRHEAPELTARNEETMDACGRVLVQGGVVCLFPEGVSHDEPRLRALRTGAARIFFRAAADGAAPKVMPAGINYESKSTFRSRVLVAFGREADTRDLGAPQPSGVKLLTRRIEAALADLVPDLDSWEELRFLRDIRSMYFGRREPSLSAEAASMRPFIQAYHYYREKDPQAVAAIRRRWEIYRRQCRRFGLEEAEVELAGAPVRAARFLASSFLISLLVFPFAAIGFVVHYPAYRISGGLERRFNRYPDMAATYKVTAGVILFALTYAVVAAVLLGWAGWRAALLSIGGLPLCGWAALRVAEERHRIQEATGALALALSSGRVLEKMRVQRQEIVEAIAVMIRRYPPEAANLR